MKMIQLHTVVRTHSLTLEEYIISEFEEQNGNYNCEMVSQDDKLVDYGENNEMPIGKKNANRQSILVSVRKKLSIVKIGREGETNLFWIGLCSSVLLTVIFFILLK